MVITARPFSSKIWSCNGAPAGARNAAEPSGFTGTVPTTRLTISLCAALREGTEIVGWPMIWLMRRRLMLPRVMGWVLSYTSCT